MTNVISPNSRRRPLTGLRRFPRQPSSSIPCSDFNLLRSIRQKIEVARTPAGRRSTTTSSRLLAERMVRRRGATSPRGRPPVDQRLRARAGGGQRGLERGRPVALPSDGPSERGEKAEIRLRRSSADWMAFCQPERALQLDPHQTCTGATAAASSCCCCCRRSRCRCHCGGVDGGAE